MQTTSQTWKTLWASGAAKLDARATIGGTTYTDEISAPVIRRALMQELPSVGNVVSATCLITLRTSDAIAPSAAVLVEMRLTDGATSSEWLPAGTFFISRRSRDPSGALLTLECYDALLKANAVWTPSAGSWPRSMSSVAAELATLLGLTQDSRNALAAYTMAEPEAGTTIRDALAAIGAANGGSWIVSPAGLLRLVPLRDAATAAAASDAAVVQGVLTNLAYAASTTVTGLRYSVDGAPTLLGTDTGAVIDMGENGTQAQSLYDVVVGMTWQGYSLEGAIYDPAAELGDGLAAGASGEIRSLLCAESITLGPLVSGDVSAPATGGVVDEYPYIGGAANKALIAAKAYANEVTEDLDDSLTQLEIFNRLTDNGAAQGMYLVDGQLYVNASYINAGYLSANRIQGGTLTLGGANDTNGVMQVLDANGNEVVLGNNKGITITKGALIVPIAYQDTGEAGSFVSINGPSGAQIPGVPIRQTDFRAVYAKSANEKYETVIDKGVLSLRNGILTSRYRPPSTDITWDGIEVNTQETQYWGMTINSFEDYDVSEQETAISAPGRIELNTYLLRFTNTGTNTKWFELVPLHMYYSGNVNLAIPLGIASGGTGASTAAGALANLGAIPASQKGAASGVAELDSNGIVPLSQLPNIVEYVSIGAESMLTRLASELANGDMVYFRTTATTTDQPISGGYMIGYAIRAGSNYIVQCSNMSDPSVMYQNAKPYSRTWLGWVKFISTTDIVNNLTSGGTTVPLSAEMGKVLNENVSILNNLHCAKYINATTLTLDIGFAPTSTSFATGILINGNRQLLALLRLDGTPSITVVNGGATTYTISLSGSTFTITPSATMWGATMILWVAV